MFLRRISILNYKNLAEVNLELRDGLTCFIGGNGEGKTNLLDAVYFLCCTKSRTNSIDSQNIRHEEPFMMLNGMFDREGVDENISVGMKRGVRKSFKRGGKEYERLADHIGLLPVVIVSPDDGGLISDGSDMRRRFVDSVIAQYDKEYLAALVRYNRMLEQRNAMLKEEIGDASLYEVCEMQMADYADTIYRKRVEFIESFIPIFQNYYRTISSDKETVDICYRSHLANGDLAAQLASVRVRDLAIGFSTRGIHKDELEMTLGGYPIKRVGSQGQSKTFLVALKLAQYDFLKQAHNGVKPILLLDDIFDKLDSSRVEQIVRLVSDESFGQILITDTNREHIDTLLRSASGKEYEIYHVENGNVVRL